MTSIEAYKAFELKINSQANSDNVDISPGEFVMLYNEQQPKWFESKFKGRTSRFVIDDVQSLAERDFALTASVVSEDYTEFSLPTNYFDYISSYCKAKKNDCSRRMRMFQVMLPDKEIYFRDEYNKPSFEYSETFVTLAKDKIQVYKTDFNVESVFLTYYRYPKAIDIAGYIKIDQSISTNIDPELIDEYVNEIIDWCVTEVQRSFKDAEGYQLSADRLNRSINN